MGRSAQMGELEAANRPVALVGPGGVGKSRVAIEYAWQQIGRRDAVLWISAASGNTLHTNLAGLCGANALNLPEQAEKELERQEQAVLQWLGAHPGWLLVLDNVDSAEAASATEALLPQLSGGQVVITTRSRNWSAAVQPIEVEVLAPEEATAFLLARTAERRRQTPEDGELARAIAVEDLGGLALALEQAGAYINQRRLSLAAYRSQWQSNREQVLTWSDAQLMQYDRSLATTWLTSYREVGDGARTLRRRLAWLAPEPIPESLLEVAVAGDPELADGALEALSELEAYSLVNRSGEAPTFTVHRLVQEVGRLWQEQAEAPEPNELEAALGWVDAAFVGDPQDVSTWAVLEPLAPHALAVARHGNQSGLPEQTARLFSELGLLLKARVAYEQAEPLMRRVVEIFEISYGSEHPNVATSLNNLATLLQATNRLEEAEPLMRRHLMIFLTFSRQGFEHPHLQAAFGNYISLLQAMGLSVDEISAKVQELMASV